MLSDKELIELYAIGNTRSHLDGLRCVERASTTHVAHPKADVVGPEQRRYGQGPTPPPAPPAPQSPSAEFDLRGNRIVAPEPGFNLAGERVDKEGYLLDAAGNRVAGQPVPGSVHPATPAPAKPFVGVR